MVRMLVALQWTTFLKRHVYVPLGNSSSEFPYFFFAFGLALEALLARAAFAITAFFADLRPPCLAPRLRAGRFFAALRAVLRLPVLRADAAFARAGLRLPDFFAAFLADFFAAFFMAMVRLSSSYVGSGCTVNACRNASQRRSLLLACRKFNT